jgi:hypothetical protein
LSEQIARKDENEETEPKSKKIQQAKIFWSPPESETDKRELVNTRDVHFKEALEKVKKNPCMSWASNNNEARREARLLSDQLSITIDNCSDDRPMDWVKQKKDRERSKPTTEFRDVANNGIKKIASPGKAVSAATAWLELLCDENIAFLQKSLPVSRRGGRRKAVSTSMAMAASMPWGLATLEAEVDEGLDVLQRLLQIYSNQLLLPGRMSKNNDREGAAASELQLKTCENIAKWINRSLPVHGSDAFVAVSCLAWSHGLSDIGRELPPGVWMEVLQNILTQIDRAWNETKPDSLFPWLLWSCEAPIALATQLTAFKSHDRLVSDAMKRLSGLLAEAADDVSPWLEKGGRNLRACLASVIRTRWAADNLGEKVWTKRERKGFRHLVEAGLTLSAPDGSCLLHEHDSEGNRIELWEAAVRTAGMTKSLQAMLDSAVPHEPTKKLRRSDKKLDLHRPSEGGGKRMRHPVLKEPGRYFENAESAVLRRSWQHAGGRVAVDFSRDPIWLDCLGAGGRRLLSGEWDLSIHRDEQSLVTDVAWGEVCWFTDDDVDYLELEAEVEGQCRIQRQIMLIRQEGWILLSDTLLASEQARWSIESSWDIPADLKFAQAEKSHEARLVDRQDGESPETLLVPLALPEWRRSPSHGKLYAESGILKLRHEVLGSRLYSPLVLVPNYDSKPAPFTWRHLTVAEDLIVQQAEIAQGYRLQVGSSQIVLYRSLINHVRRSVLGLHLNSEFYCGRFDPDEGDCEPIVEISSDE